MVNILTKKIIMRIIKARKLKKIPDFQTKIFQVNKTLELSNFQELSTLMRAPGSHWKKSHFFILICIGGYFQKKQDFKTLEWNLEKICIFLNIWFNQTLGYILNSIFGKFQVNWSSSILFVYWSNSGTSRAVLDTL